MTVTQKFLRCHEVTSGWEGGWSNHPNDPGGKTMYGVTEAVYHAWLKSQGRPLRPVRSITRQEALELYFDEYWRRCGGPTLDVGVDLATYDSSVNSGVSRGRKWLLASLGGPAHETVKKICAKRLGFVQSLTHLWGDFGRGWSNRIADIQAKGVAWALAAQAAPPVVQEKLRDEAKKADDTARGQQTGGAAAGATGGGAVAVDQTTDVVTNVPQWGVVAAAVVLFAVAAYLLLKSRQKRQQAEAYRREATS